MSLISLKSATQASLERLGGGAGRNWSPLAVTNGATSPAHGICASGYAPAALGVRRQTPGPAALSGNEDVPPYGGYWRPSPARIPMIWSAAACPTAMPLVSEAPSGISPSDVVREARRAAWLPGK